MKDKELLPQIAEAYRQLGLYIFQRDYCISPNLIVIHYDLHNIDRLLEVKRKLELVSASLHYDMEFKKSDIAHFAIVIPVKDKKQVLFSNKKYETVFTKPFTIFAGIDENNKPVGVHLNKSPHILIGGETGAGKSMLLDDVICSLLKTSSYDKLSLFLFDTKIVELSKYKKIEHNCKISTDIDAILGDLKNICSIMKERYLYMEKNELQQFPEEDGRIVIIIDELSDLVYEGGKTLENYLVKISRLGRAANINLIVATQRPVAKTIPTELKTNMSCRFGLKTASVRDSMNILDYKGCEKLNGDGDCLLKAQKLNGLIRIQCPLLTKDDIHKCIEDYNNGESLIWF